MGKDKPPRHVALAIVYSVSTHRILMVTSRKHAHLWILPKGGIEVGETSGEAAVREAWEEAGSLKDLPAPTDDSRLMMLALEPTKGQKRASVWHVHVVKMPDETMDEDWPEKHERQRQWFSPSECQEKIREWYRDPNLADEVEPDSAEVKASGKKEKKGGAMETALRAFADLYGWEKTL